MHGWVDGTYEKNLLFTGKIFFFFGGGVKSSAEITVLFKARWLGIVILMFG